MHVFICYVSGLISLVYGKIVLLSSFLTLLARVTYMSYGGGGQEVKRISVNPSFSAPTHGVGGGEEMEGAYFSVNTTCVSHIMV
jgi:hypothetical protein